MGKKSESRRAIPWWAKLALIVVPVTLVLLGLEGAARLYVWKVYGAQDHGMNWKFHYEPYVLTRTESSRIARDGAHAPPRPAKSDRSPGPSAGRRQQEGQQSGQHHPRGLGHRGESDRVPRATQSGGPAVPLGPAEGGKGLACDRVGEGGEGGPGHVSIGYHPNTIIPCLIIRKTRPVIRLIRRIPRTVSD